MQKYIDKLLTLGCDSAKVIEPHTIVTAPWTIYKCQYGCSRYGNSHCCPPKCPGYKQTQEIINAYQTAILFRCHDMGIVAKNAVELARDLFLDGYYKAIGFGSGPCNVCAKCNPITCNFPDKTVPAMEACGIDVFATVRNNGYEIHTLRSKDEVQNHFGLLLVE